MARPRKVKEGESPNDELTGLLEIDYANLTGKAFDDYGEIESQLFMNEKYDFELWVATSVLKFKFDEDSGEKTQYMNGVRLHSNKPVQVTRMTVQQAREINKHVKSGVNESRNSKYMLLVKPKPVTEEA